MWGQWGRVRVEGASGGGAPFECPQDRPFDRLRANGNAKRACDVGWWGRAAARRTSGYRLSPVRRLGVFGTRGGWWWRRALRQAQGERRGCEATPAMWVGGGVRPPGAPLDTGFRLYDGGGSEKFERRRRRRAAPLPRVPALRENDGGGSGGNGRCWWWGASPGYRTVGAAAPLDSPFDFPQGERPHHGPAPVGLGTVLGYVAGISRERRLEVCGTRGGWWWRRALRQAQGERNLEARLRCGLVGACRRPFAPLDTGFRRYDGGGCGEFERRRRAAHAPLPWDPAKVWERRWGGGVPLADAVSGCRTPPLWIPAFAGMTLGVVRERRWESAGRAGAAWWGREPFDRLRANGISIARLRCGLVGACRRPAHLWIPAFAGTTMAGVGMTRHGDGPAPRPCPGFRRRRERRLGERCRLQKLCRVAAPRPSGFLPSQE